MPPPDIWQTYLSSMIWSNPSFHSVACHFFCLHSTYTWVSHVHNSLRSLPLGYSTVSPRNEHLIVLWGKFSESFGIYYHQMKLENVGGDGKHSQKWRRCWTCPWPGTPTVVPVIWWGSILILAKVYAWEASILQCKSWLECNKPYHWANHKSLQSLKFIVKHDLECKKTLHGNRTLYNQTKQNRTEQCLKKLTCIGHAWRDN